MTEQTTNEGHEPRILREVTPSEGVLTSLFQDLLWETCGQRDCSEIARYLYLGDASIVINNSAMTFEEFTLQDNEGAAVDGIKVTLTAPEGRGFREMPTTDEEESGIDEILAELEEKRGELESAHQAIRSMESQIRAYERKLGMGDPEGTA